MMEKELLSIVELAQEYRHMLLGMQCQFHCDHKTLVSNLSDLSASVAGAPPLKSLTTLSSIIQEKKILLLTCSVDIQ
jgi:hypothetical protein